MSWFSELTPSQQAGKWEVSPVFISETQHLAGLEDQSRAPTAPVRKVWLPVMLEV